MMASSAIRGIPPGRSKVGLASASEKHGGFDADLTGSAVEDQIYFRAEAVAYVIGGGGRKSGEAVGTGRGERNLGGADQGSGDGMRGHAHGDGGQARGDDIGNCRLLFDNQLLENQG